MGTEGVFIHLKPRWLTSLGTETGLVLDLVLFQQIRKVTGEARDLETDAVF